MKCQLFFKNPMSSTEQKFTPDKTEMIMEASALLKTLSHPVRLGILCTIIAHGEINAGDIIAELSHMCSASQISQYLTILKDQKLVETRREGQFVYYRLGSAAAEDIIAALYKHYCV